MALAAFKEKLPLSQLAAKYEVHPNQISKWKREARQSLPAVFGTVKRQASQEHLVSSLYEKIGRLEMELA